MSDEIIEAYSVPEITADEIANARIIGSDMHLQFWAWHVHPDGEMQKVLVGRVRMPVAGIVASRPIITAALQGQQPGLHKYRMLGIAH